MPVSECGKIREKSGCCLSGVKRSEFSRVPNFLNERTNPKGGIVGCPFFGSVSLGTQRNEHKN